MWGRVVGYEVPGGVRHLPLENLVNYCKEFGFYLE